MTATSGQAAPAKDANVLGRRDLSAQGSSAMLVYSASVVCVLPTLPKQFSDRAVPGCGQRGRRFLAVLFVAAKAERHLSTLQEAGKPQTLKRAKEHTNHQSHPDLPGNGRTAWHLHCRDRDAGRTGF